MEYLCKICAAVARRRPDGSRQSRNDTSPLSPPQLELNTNDASAAEPEQPQDELQQLPRQPETLHATQNSARNAEGEDTTAKPRKLSKLAALASLTNLVSDHPRNPTAASTANTASLQHSQRSKLFDRLLALPPELQLKVLSYLDFGDLERLRRTCRSVRNGITPQMVRSLLSPNFDHHIRNTCYICLEESQGGQKRLISTDKFHLRFPFSSRCEDCVRDAEGFDVGRKYLMADNTTSFVCRWCGSPATEPQSTQPEFDKRCFKRFFKVVVLYNTCGLAQWVVTIIACGLSWHYFRTRAMWVVGVVVAGFVITLWNFCLGAVRGSFMRTYHFTLILEACIFASWFAPLLQLFRMNSERMPYRAMNSYELATVVFIIFNLISRGVNVIGNFILMCEYKLWRHKKRDMSLRRSVWIHILEVFMFYVEPQCIEQKYPPRWWLLSRQQRMLAIYTDATMPVVDVTEAGQEELDQQRAVVEGLPGLEWHANA
ncbi:Cyclin-like F-box [Cordyceps fumosorosea ARSEF 2679]|uniref:Cyclin-like F-box n=1 Tax=Cordyceps fumosorosea (strain ARSEF 2679) TaxID=1081104 RepID=A0A162K3J7_CORFA|nr:Cyclin-like F-box [Cordyceps fumosorosea ARSEF 2679]OAA52848.1 Cyclin-like F-box [Cordyceps fumosorosea ARSEF 2679]